MKMFNIKRFAILYRNEVISNYKKWLIFLVTIIGIYTLIAIINGIAYKYAELPFNGNKMNNMFPFFLFLGGYIATSFIFADINNKLKNSLWFSIPGTTLEKYLVGLVGSSVGFVVFLIISFIFASLISSLLTLPLFGIRCNVFNPLKLSMGSGTIEIKFMWISLIYILTQSVFIVGSITFKNAAFIKTVLVSVGILILYSILTGIIIKIVSSTGTLDSLDVRIFLNFFEKPYPEIKSIFIRMIVFSNILFSIFFNCVGYLKLVEKEVKGGI